MINWSKWTGREGQAVDPAMTIKRVKVNFFQDLLNSKRERGAGLVVKVRSLIFSPSHLQ